MLFSREVIPFTLEHMAIKQKEGLENSYLRRKGFLVLFSALFSKDENQKNGTVS